MQAAVEREVVAERRARRRLTVPTVSASAAAVRNQVRVAALGRGLPAAWTEELALAVDEAFSNAVHHGTGTAADETEVTVEPESGGICVSLRYPGEPFDTRVQELPADMFQIGGRGRFLMRQLLDAEEYQFADGMTMLRMFKRY